MQDLSLFDVLPDATVALPAQTPRTRPLPAAQRRQCLLAVDGNSLTHRAFHAYHGAHDAGAIYGFLALLAAVCDVTFPDAIVVGFDCRSSSSRRDRYPAYKANRLQKDPALDEALDAVPTLLIELGVNVTVAAGWEADDVVGSAAAAAEGAGWRCVVATSDRDAFALISDDTTVLRLRSGMENSVLVDAQRLRREAGVAPNQYVEFSALRGDTSDNLPGIPGIGPAKAAALLRAFPTVADAVADPIGCRSVLGKALGQTLIDDLADARQSVFRRNVDLMTVQRDVPVDIEACRPRISPDHASATLRSWGVRGIDGRVALALAVRPELPPLPAGMPT